MNLASGKSSWAARASALYDEAYARKYRTHDDQLVGSRAYEQFVDWLGDVRRRLDHQIDVLDLGCGTGRYFWVFDNVRSLTGLDASAAMIAEAQTPFRATQISAGTIHLVCGDLLTTDFPDSSFDLVYSVGVLAEHTPLTVEAVRRVAQWTRPNGLFAFTTVHPDSNSVPRTFLRRIATAVAAWAPGRIHQTLRDRLMVNGLYADQEWIAQVLAPHFVVESLIVAESEAHLHCLCVARKVTS